MPHNKARALCAQIALEIDPSKAAALIDELTQVLLGDYLKLLDKTQQELQLKPGRKADASQSDRPERSEGRGSESLTQERRRLRNYSI